MATKPDLVTPIAVGLAELINARPRSPSLEELRAHLHTAYLSAMSTTAMPADTRTRLAESMAAPRAEAVLALINAKPGSPTAEEIRNVLAPSRTPVSAWAEADVRSADAGDRVGADTGDRADAGDRAAEGDGSYYDDPDCEIAICAHAASAYIPRLKRERPDLSGPHLWLEAIKLAREAGLSVDPLD